MRAIEHSVSAISLDALRKICSLFGISADAIIFGKSEPSNDVYNIAQQLARIKPEYQPQVNKLLSALLELSAIIQDGETKPNDYLTPFRTSRDRQETVQRN